MFPSIPAGNFSEWLQNTLSSQTKDGSDVPCGSCTACCTSSQFIHIRPDEVQTLKQIPKTLLFPAPMLPQGHVLMGYNEQGHCPMFIEGKCSIYVNRPQTCRIYDCRIFAATQIELDNEAQISIRDQARRWKFQYPNLADQATQSAVHAAARFLTERQDLFPPKTLPHHPAVLANLALKVHQLFLSGTESGTSNPLSVSESVQAILKLL